MVLTRDAIVKRLSVYLKGSYDINELEGSQAQNAPVLRCDLHVSNQKFFMFKSAVIWEANCHEYLYVFSVSHLTKKLAEDCLSFVQTEGGKLITPAKNHMYTYLTALIVCDSIEPDAERLIKKSHVRKDFKFSLHGWMELHTAYLSCDSGKYSTNRSGREMKKLLKNIGK